MTKETLVLLAVASFAMSVGSRSSQAHDLAMQGSETEQKESIRMDGLSVWLRARFSEIELEGLRPGEVAVEAHFCGCYDKPTGHYPYSIVLLRTSKGDLVARPEAMEGTVSFTPLAVRYGIQYCELESEEDCYGSFSDPCEFTDFRYGPYLAKFFPTCRTDEMSPP